jgi:hypothetical protein
MCKPRRMRCTRFSSAAERQDSVTLAKYVDSASIVSGLIAPFEAHEEAEAKKAQEFTEAKKTEARRAAAASNDPFALSLERMKESTVDLALQSTTMKSNALLRTDADNHFRARFL